MASAKYILQINNIPWTIGRQQLAQYFSQFGYVRNATVVFDKTTGFNQGYGYVTFAKKEDLGFVLENKHSLEGKTLSLKYAKLDLNDDIFN
ncbi:SRA stem-loop-interacting RNA-binding protein, mitochondrial-like [Odontomachus brunneus]|uniref:SRA stem-loop-interacting RNA-binding protein, mitochondrial-like n=1 Tax=Odontomachus brunneus TaxID=486640 RepID=UPI0013F27DD4|nr:SRA stem-loop-interacting RNA-binding protein, mitochondrial-like [Odontomachus brunneus]